MGFYGNITNVNKTSLTFDKIYSNRKAMDEAANSDGIYVGRFVLVDYNEGVPAHNYTRVYQIGFAGYKNNFYIKNENNNDYRARYSSEPYYVEEIITKEDGTTETVTKINPKRDDSELQLYLFIGEVVYTFNESSKVYKFYIVKEAKDTEWAILEEIETPVDAEPYFDNFIIDRREYGDSIGRGYDSTVWQKVYTSTEDAESGNVKNVEKYVMLAELNSVVPTFDVTVDAPTINPIKPHFDVDTTNIYYKLHVQPSWGFRVKELTEDDDYLSDQTASSDEIIWDPILKKRMNVGKTKYDAAIYYNKQGFEADKRYEKKQPNNLITVKNTGSSEQIYNIHSTSDGKTKLDTANDIQEFVFQLPSIGNTMSDIWNIIYGYGDLIEDENGTKVFRRNKNIEWNNLAGERLVTVNADGSGFSYKPEKVKTIAGCINSIHDLMGMIVTEEQKDSTDNALMNRIYYGDYREEKTEEPYKGYYIKELTYEIEEKELEDIQNLVINDMKEFSKDTYYYMNDNNYYLETEKYDSGNQYYSIEVSEPIDFYDKDYEPNKFYYKDNGNFRLAATTYAVPGTEYYYTESEIKAETIIDNSKDQRFFPKDRDYFNKYFKSKSYDELEEVEGTNGRIKTGDGWFYYDANDVLYKPFTYVENREYIQKLYYITGFLVERAVDAITQEVQWVYEFDKGANKIEYTTFNFEPNKYYYYQPNEENEELPGSYILLKSEKEIDIEKIYLSFPSDNSQFILIDKEFYIPNSYHCKEGNDYIFATEDKKQIGKKYYNILNSELITDVFYEPYKYYYLDWDNEYSLDTNDIMTPERTYYKEGVHYYVKYDPRGILKSYSKLNNALIQNLPKDVIIGPRKEVYKWRELEGFSRTLNSIHGMLLELNRIIRFEDKVTRDERTLAGTLNKINDVLTTIGKLTPGQIVVTDNYGRMTTANSNATQEVKSTKTEYDYQSEAFVNTETVIDDKGSWVGFEVTLDEENVTTDIAFGHKYNPVTSTKKDTDMNTVGDIFGLVRPVVDNMGHIVAMDNENIKLPNSYKSIITGDTSAIAQNSKDEIKIDTDQWLAVKAENDENGKSLITFTHEYPTNELVIENEKVNINNTTNNIITYIKDMDVDTVGHIVSKKYTEFTLPYGFKFVEDENNIAIEAENTQDIFKIVGDLEVDENNNNYSWIKTNVSTDEKLIKISHDVPTAMESRSLENINLQFGDSFDIEDWVFDNKGHKANVSTHSISIPKGSLESKDNLELSNSNVIVDMELVPESGKITIERKDIVDLKLTEVDNISTEVIDFSEDTLGVALSKLQNQLKVLNDNSFQEGSVDFKIAQAISEIVEENEDSVLNTLNEVIEWITDDEIEGGAVSIQNSISKIEENFNSNVNSIIDEKTFEYNSNQITINKLIEHIIDLEARIQALESPNTEEPENPVDPEPTPDPEPELPEEGTE